MLLSMMVKNKSVIENNIFFMIGLTITMIKKNVFCLKIIIFLYIHFPTCINPS